jgi:MFS family permease
MYESGMFEKSKSKDVVRGNFLLLFNNLKRFKNYVFLILAGIPCWFVVGILVINSPAFATDALHISEPVKGSTAVMLHYIGASIGSFLLGLLSRRWRSRKKALYVSIISITILLAASFFMGGVSRDFFYSVIFLLGVAQGGLWTIFVTSASEMFGTNIRATVTTTAPNFVRGSTVLIILYLNFLKPSQGLWAAGLIVGSTVVLISAISIFFLKETYDRNLDYVEK